MFEFNNSQSKKFAFQKSASCFFGKNKKHIFLSKYNSRTNIYFQNLTGIFCHKDFKLLSLTGCCSKVNK